MASRRAPSSERTRSRFGSKRPRRTNSYAVAWAGRTGEMVRDTATSSTAAAEAGGQDHPAHAQPGRDRLRERRRVDDPLAARQLEHATAAARRRSARARRGRPRARAGPRSTCELGQPPAALGAHACARSGSGRSGSCRGAPARGRRRAPPRPRRGRARRRRAGSATTSAPRSASSFSGRSYDGASTRTRSRSPAAAEVVEQEREALERPVRQHDPRGIDAVALRDPLAQRLRSRRPARSRARPAPPSAMAARAQSASSSTGRHSGAGAPRANEIGAIGRV